MACSKEAMESNLIAKALYAGATAAEVSEEFNRSIGHVLAQKRKYEQQQREIQARIIARRARQIPPQRAEVIEMRRRAKVRLLKSAVGMELGIRAVEEPGKPSLPYVGILHGR